MGSWFISGDSHEIAWFSDADRDATVDRIQAIVVRRRSRTRAEHAPVSPAVLRDWSGSVGTEGPEQVLYSRERALVRVGGRDFSLPGDGRALLILIDDRLPNVDRPAETHIVSAPPVARVALDPAASKAVNRQRMQEHLREVRIVWHRWLDDEPLIRAFLGT